MSENTAEIIDIFWRQSAVVVSLMKIVIKLDPQSRFLDIRKIFARNVSLEPVEYFRHFDNCCRSFDRLPSFLQTSPIKA